MLFVGQPYHKNNSSFKACVRYFSLFLKDMCISSLFRTKYIEKKFNLQLLFFPLFHENLLALLHFRTPGRHSWQNLNPTFRNCREMPGRFFIIFEFSFSLFSLLSYFRHQAHGKTWFIIFSAWLKNYVKYLNLKPTQMS